MRSFSHTSRPQMWRLKTNEFFFSNPINEGPTETHISSSRNLSSVFLTSIPFLVVVKEHKCNDLMDTRNESFSEIFFLMDPVSGCV